MNKSENARRKPMQIYVPRHRRVAQSDSESTDVKTTMEGRLSPRVNPSSSPDEVVRRGRGQFRAPASANGKDVQRNNDVEPSNHAESHTKPSITQSISIPNQSSPNNNSLSNGLRSNNKNVSMDELTAQTEKLMIDEGDSPKEDWEELLDILDKEEEEEKKAAESAKRPTIPASNSRSPPTEYTNVLDCYGFPTSYKTHHLHGIFNKYESSKGGYKIKWMDDTRALIIFAHPQTAKRAYLENIDNVQLKLRPYTGPIEFSETTDGQPIPRRPATTDMVARRLVHGALGVRGPARTAEQRQAERDLLQAERDRREAKRRQEAQRSQAISDAFNE